MSHEQAKQIVTALLERAGITLNGSSPWDLRVNDERFYARVLRGGSLAAGDAYMDGWWDCEALDQCLTRFFRAGLYERLAYDWAARLHAWTAQLLNRQTRRLSHQVAEQHYNLGNDVFGRMLDRRMNYTCAYWEGARDLDSAQEAKLELICRKLELRPGLKVLEYGCGWGAFAKYAAEKYGANVLGVNIAEEQVRLARRLCRGLPVEIRLQDYRDVRGQYDRVVSIGIMEHVGPKNYRAYMRSAHRCLKKEGIAFIHTIGHNVANDRGDPWFDKHIFPNGVTPALSQLAAAAEGLFVIEDVHNIGPDYDPTLMAWHENLTRHWPELSDKYGERFYRMMKFYLLASAASFRSRQSQLYQIVMTKTGRRQPHCRVDARPVAELVLSSTAA